MPDLTNDTPELNIGEIADSIGQDMFGGDAAPNQQSGEGGQPGAQPGSPVAPGTPASPPANLTPAQVKALPKAWKKEMQAYWEKLDPAVHDYVYQREADVMRGIQQYQDGHKRWGDLTTPFQQLLEANPGINPVELFQNLARNHIALLQAPEAQKFELAKKLLSHYGLDLGKLTGGNPPPQQQELPPQVTQALQRLERLESQFSQSSKESQQAREAKALEEVERFFGDKENYPFAEEAADDIHRLMATRAADSLKSAYEMAIWTNPAIREKVLAAQQAAQRKPGPKAPNLDNSSGGAKPPPINGTGDIFADIDEIARNAFKH